MRDLDPESVGFHEYSSSENNLDIEDSLSRSHYVDVSKSRIREDDLTVDEKKYGGQTVSRSAIYSDSDVSNDGEDFEMELDSDMEGSEVSEETNLPSISEQRATVTEPERSSSNPSAKEDLKIFNNAPKEVNNDSQKGLSVKNQISIFENVLDSRIRAQKCLSLVNSATFPETNSVDSLDTLAEYIDTLLSLKYELAAQSSIKVASSNSRKNHSGDDFFLHAMQDSMKMDKSIESHRNENIDKWQQKAQLSIVAGKNLKALTQTVPTQIANMLDTDWERLSSRTHINRSQGSQQQTELFDDNDFYAQFLREFIDSKVVEDPQETARQWALLKSLQTKKRKDVERKASKGRKMRYDVHEKLQNFMVPIDRSTWHDEMTRELFTALVKICS